MTVSAKRKIYMKSLKSEISHTAETACFLFLAIAAARLAAVMLPDYWITGVLFWLTVIIFILTAARLFFLVLRYLKEAFQ